MQQENNINSKELADLVSLAAIDLSQPEEAIIAQMMEQFTTVGFAYVRNFSEEWDE